VAAATRSPRRSAIKASSTIAAELARAGDDDVSDGGNDGGDVDDLSEPDEEYAPAPEPVAESASEPESEPEEPTPKVRCAWLCGFNKGLPVSSV
jgi:hypothetical protein